MAATIDATVGGTSANSYVTVAEADTYFEGQLNVTAWTGATADEKVRALIMAAGRLEQLQYRGIRYESDQALAWPRSGVRDQDGRLFGTDEIPVRVERAQMKLARTLLDEPTLLEDTGLEGFRSLKVGPIALETRLRAGGTEPADVLRELSPLLVGGGAVVQLQRS